MSIYQSCDLVFMERQITRQGLSGWVFHNLETDLCEFVENFFELDCLADIYFGTTDIGDERVAWYEYQDGIRTF